MQATRSRLVSLSFISGGTNPHRAHRRRTTSQSGITGEKNMMTGEVTAVKSIGQEREVTFRLSNGETASFVGQGTWQGLKVGDIVPEDVVRVFDSLVAKVPNVSSITL